MFQKRAPVEAPPDIQDIPTGYVPTQVVQGHRIMSQKFRKRGGQPPARLPKKGYRTAADFMIGETAIQIGSLDGTTPALGVETTKRIFALAAHLGELGALSMERFRTHTNNYHIARVGLEAPLHDSFLVYGQEDKVAIRRSTGVGTSAYTTGRTLLRPGDASISFVGVPAAGPTIETKMAVATESIQNRLHVVSVTAQLVEDTEPRHCEPFQESLANGLGNMIGYIADGRRYGEYREYVQEIHSKLAVYGHNALDGNGMMVAPHLLARKALYEQIIEGELPAAEDINFIPLLPDPR